MIFMSNPQIEVATQSGHAQKFVYANDGEIS